GASLGTRDGLASGPGRLDGDRESPPGGAGGEIRVAALERAAVNEPGPPASGGGESAGLGARATDGAGGVRSLPRSRGPRAGRGGAAVTFRVANSQPRHRHRQKEQRSPQGADAVPPVGPTLEGGLARRRGHDRGGGADGRDAQGRRGAPTGRELL